MNAHPEIYCRNRNGLKDIYLQKANETPKVPPVVYWFHGPTGSGKTRKAIEIGEAAGSYWISNRDLQWFDGYCGQKVAIIDDFRRDFCTFHYLLRLLDRYNLDVPIKGAESRWMPEVIIITCPVAADELWLNEDG